MGKRIVVGFAASIPDLATWWCIGAWLLTSCLGVVQKKCWQRGANVGKERQEPNAIFRVSLRHNSKGANSISTSPVDSNSFVLATSKWLCRSDLSPARGGPSSVLLWFVRTRHWRRGPQRRQLRRLASPTEPTSAQKKVLARRDAGSGASIWTTRSQRPN